MAIGKCKPEFRGRKSLVLAITALMVAVAFSASIYMSDNARAIPTPLDNVLQPTTVPEGNPVTVVLQNFTNVGTPVDAVIFMNPADVGCSGAAGQSQFIPMGPVYTVINSTFTGNEFYPHLHVGYIGPGIYYLYMALIDDTGLGCGNQMILTVTGPDRDPPYVASISGLPAADPPTANNPNPSFSADPVVFGDIPNLRVTIDETPTGGGMINAGEFFPCGPSPWPTPCVPPSMIPGTGAPLQLYNDNPWIPGPQGQSWGTQVFVYTETQVNTGLLGVGTYWFWIHGNDSADNWGDFTNATQENTRWYVLSLNITGSGNNPPVLSWTGEPGYVLDGVDPDVGDLTTIFEYRVNYTDADDDAPSSILVHIEIPCGVPWVGSPFAMTEDNPLDTVYSDGKLYTHSTMISPLGNYEHYFTASDGIDAATGAPTIPCTAGPTVGGAVPPAPPPNLWVERSNPDIIVHWDAVAGADSYNVYRSNDRHALFSTWTSVVELTTSWTHLGAYGDTNTWYYVVRADNTTAGESTNSTMGVKLHKDLGTPSGIPGRNVYWISIPYVSMYRSASDLVMDIEGSMGAPSMINAVCKWNPATQNAVMFLYAGRWRGNDFPINPGDGICLNSINPAWTWVINGTDTRTTLGFTYNIMLDNVNWISMPYTNSYQTASNIVRDIEGSLVTPPTKISVVAMWDPAAQDLVKYEWTGAAWTGTDFTVDSGDGLHLDILSTFIWQPALITPSVP